MRRQHPITILRRQRIDRQKYDAIREDVASYWAKVLPDLDDPVSVLIEAQGRSQARAARFQDKFEIVRQIVGSAANRPHLSDEDVLAILTGWSPLHVVRDEGEEE